MHPAEWGGGKVGMSQERHSGWRKPKDMLLF